MQYFITVLLALVYAPLTHAQTAPLRQILQLPRDHGFLELDAANQELYAEFYDVRADNQRFRKILDLSTVPLRIDDRDVEEPFSPTFICADSMNNIVVAGSLTRRHEGVLLQVGLKKEMSGAVEGKWKWLVPQEIYRDPRIKGPRYMLDIPKEAGLYAILDRNGSVFLLDIPARFLQLVVAIDQAAILSKARSLSMGYPSGPEKETSGLRFDLLVLDSDQGPHGTWGTPIVVAYNNDGDRRMEKVLFAADNGWVELTPDTK